MKLLLIRHGESRHAAQKIIATHEACTGLTEQGFQQARDLALHLKPVLPKDCLLVSSPALRARETARQLSQVLDLKLDLPEPSLLEIATGTAEGLSWAEYYNMYGTLDLVDDPNRPFAPGGECWTSFLKRVESLLKRWSEQYTDQTVIAVTHAGFIVAAFIVLFAIPRPGTGTRLDPDYASLTEWQVHNQIWSLVRFNDLSHLTP